LPIRTGFAASGCAAIGAEASVPWSLSTIETKLPTRQSSPIVTARTQWMEKKPPR